jgi:hypothetical protein
MILRIKKPLADKIGVDKLTPFGLSEMSWRHREWGEIDLGRLEAASLSGLEKLLSKHAAGDRAVMTLINDVRRWVAAKKDAKSGRPRTLQQFEGMLKKYLQGVPGHRIYLREDDVTYAYYVDKIAYESGAYCEEILADVRRTRPDAVILIENGPHFLYEDRTLDYGSRWWKELKLNEALAAGRLIGVDADPRRAWMRRILGLER